MNSRTSSSATAANKPSLQRGSAQNAALKGACAAFSNSPPKSKVLAKSPTRDNGARPLPGLTRSRSNASVSPAELAPLPRPQPGGNSIASNPSHTPFVTTSFLDPPSTGGRGASRSPSDIAAKLAAARHSPLPVTSGRMSRTQSPERLDNIPQSGSVSKLKARLNAAAEARALDRDLDMYARSELAAPGRDALPVRTTASLVNAFEQRTPSKARVSAPASRSTQDGTRRQSTELVGNVQKPKASPPPIKSPKPQRASPLLTKHAHNGFQLPSVPAKPPLERASTLSAPSDKPAKPAVPKSKPTIQAPPETFEPKPSHTATAARPDLPPPRRAAKKLPPSVDAKTPSGAPVQVPPRSQSVQGFVRSPASGLSVPSNPLNSRSPSPGKPPTQAEVNALANAIVASNLASRSASTSASRTASPTRKAAPPPLPNRHKQKHHHHPFHRSRSNSPVKPTQGTHTLRKTLREEPSSSDSDAVGYGYGDKRRAKKHIVRKHPNKHHEGDRKRWRTRITERERKRYEGLWAANRGAHLSPLEHASAENDVLNVAVREIWCRSRLPSHVLEEVWDLVDLRGGGRLSREEFVVGTWLVDQRLKGRKLPQRVQDSVWASVRSTGGLKVRLK